MAWLLCVSLLLLASAVLGDDDHGENVLQYTNDNFAEAVKENPHLVMFYAPWCGHCKSLSPTFDKLAKKHNVDLDKKDVTIAKVDCTEQTALCSDHGVKGYPTLKFFQSGSDPEKYAGQRSLEALDQFIQAKVNPGKAAEDEAGDGGEAEITEDGLYVLTDKTFAAAIATGTTFVKFYAPWCGHCKRLIPAWDALARENKDKPDVRIAKVDCTQHSSVCQTYGVRGYPTLILFKDGQKDEQYQQSREQAAMSDFLAKKSGSPGGAAPAFKEPEPEKPAEKEVEGLTILTEDNFEETIISQEHALIKFYAPWCGHCKNLAPTWDQLAAEYIEHDNVIIGKVDCTIHKAVCSKHEVRGYPTLLYFHNGERIEKYSGGRSKDNFVTYMDKKLLTVTAEDRDKLRKEDVSKEELPPKLDGSVVHLDGETFDKTIASGITFVKFFAPWCGHCKALAPTWAELSAGFANKPKVTIAKVDCTLHEKLCEDKEIEGFPTLFLYKDGVAQGEYEGERDLAALRTYVMDAMPRDEL